LGEISTRIFEPMKSEPFIEPTAEWASFSLSNSRKAKPGGLNATHTLVSLPYLANSTSRSSFFTFSRMLPT